MADEHVDAGVDPTTIVDEVATGTDHFGDLSSSSSDDDGPDPDRDPDEVWFEADELAAASTVDLGVEISSDPDASRGGDRLVRAPTIEHLVEAISRPGISLAELPGWPEAGASGQGLGPLAHDLIGELRPGDLVVIGGAQRGVGRTTLLAQIGDGLALAGILGRSGGKGASPTIPTTPVLVVGGGDARSWRARTLARYFGVDARVFVERDHARDEPRLAAMRACWASCPWADIDAGQRFAPYEAFADASSDLHSETLAELRRWQVERSRASGVVAQPIVIVDPVESIGDGDLLATLTRLSGLAKAEGWIVLASCDVHAGQSDRALARAIDSLASVRVGVTSVDEDGLVLESLHRRLGPRGTGRLRWHRPSGRVRPRE